MSKELWIDRDECMMWFDMKPTCEAMGHEVDYKWVAKIEVSEQVYAKYLQHCEDVRLWQITLEDWYLAEMKRKEGEVK